VGGVVGKAAGMDSTEREALNERIRVLEHSEARWKAMIASLKSSYESETVLYEERLGSLESELREKKRSSEETVTVRHVWNACI
jgi:hypothetical protein